MNGDERSSGKAGVRRVVKGTTNGKASDDSIIVQRQYVFSDSKSILSIDLENGTNLAGAVAP